MPADAHERAHDVISDGEARYLGPNFQDNARAFMAENDGAGQRNRPIRDRQIAVADTAGGELEQHFAAPWWFHNNRFDDRGAIVPADDRLGFHAWQHARIVRRIQSGGITFHYTE